MPRTNTDSHGTTNLLPRTNADGHATSDYGHGLTQSAADQLIFGHGLTRTGTEMIGAPRIRAKLPHVEEHPWETERRDAGLAGDARASKPTASGCASGRCCADGRRHGHGPSRRSRSTRSCAEVYGTTDPLVRSACGAVSRMLRGISARATSSTTARPPSLLRR